MEKIRVGIDARLYGPAQRGLGRYTESIIRAIELSKSNVEIVLYIRPNEELKKELLNRGFIVESADYAPYSLKEQILFGFQLNRAKLDLVHFPHFNVPLLYRGKYVVTIHDLILHHFPTRIASSRSFIIYWFKILIYRLLFKRNVHKAKAIIVVSSFVEEDLLTYYPKLKGKVSVVMEAISILSLHTNLRTDKKDNISYNIKGKYVLLVGAFYPHKNLDCLVVAWQQIFYDTDIKLVFVGKIDNFALKLKALVNKLDLRKDDGEAVMFIGEVSDIVLYELYKNAEFLIVPSLIEGFGLPGMEALLSGICVVSSSAGALPETYENNATYVPVNSVINLQKSISAILNNKSLLKKPNINQKITEQEIGKKLMSTYLSIVR